MSDINRTLRNMIDEIDLDRRVNEFVGQAETALRRAVGTAAEFAHEHRDDVDRALDQLSTRIDERTEGKYSERVEKVRERVDIGLTKLGEHRPDAGA